MFEETELLTDQSTSGPMAVDAGTSFVFGTKAETLDRLRMRLGSKHLCPQVWFTVGQWSAQRAAVLDNCLRAFPSGELVVRSSALREDSVNGSMAGAFHSVIGVSPDLDALSDGVSRVIASYGAGCHQDDQVLVQPRIADIAIAGVIMTRDLDSGAPYYVINYDDMTGSTNSVTSGAISKTVLVHCSRAEALRSPRLQNLVETVQTIETETGDDKLDIEFCIQNSGQLYILQVRPLASRKSWPAIGRSAVDLAIDNVREGLRQVMTREAGILGATTVFGQMPDWNPAEMIGSIPKPLTYSIYERLITRSAWADARARMGYRDMRGFGLMRCFAGQPYIDVRLSLNSFLPAGISESVGERLVGAQLSRLSENRDLHDKIEFEVAFPSFDFRFDSRRSELRDAGLNEDEIEAFRNTLRSHTASLIRGSEPSKADIEARLVQLEAARQRLSSSMSIESLRGMLDACVPFGTVPFAEAARHAFIGVSFLKSLVAIGELSADEIDDYLASFNTVAHDLVQDMVLMQRGRVAREEFLQRYGHLRPGTYDITSYRYDEKPEIYLGECTRDLSEPKPFKLTTKASRIGGLVEGIDGSLTVEALFKYVREAIQLRELAKFQFTRTVSDCLRQIARWGESKGLDREALAYLSIDDVLAHGDGSITTDRLTEARSRYEVFRLVRLPHIITHPDDVDVVRVPLNKPTYITQARVVAPIMFLKSNEVAPIDNRVVMIESADPGFDWIFSHNIAGLITKFGGANSHMAIRCAEFRTPAAIGCGEKLFGRLLDADIVTLDCAARTVSPAHSFDF